MTFCSTIRASLVFCLLFTLACRAGTSEALEYQVIYRGVFSAGADMPIVDLLLDAPMQGHSTGIRQIGLTASSLNYPLVESIFPIRYRFRSWIDPSQQGQLLGFETYERTRKLRHRLYLRDESAAGMRRYDLTEGEGQHEMAQLEAGASPMTQVRGGQLLDRLGLLQRLRKQDLLEQAKYDFAVTNGRERLDYRVKVEAAQTVTVGGFVVPAWKLRFDGLERGRDGRRVAAHRPVYVWLSRTSARIPLRVDSRQPIGLFRVELKNRTALNQLAQAGS